jgi:aminopeptidase N
MFDQPNLKGTFEITVALPKEWDSITTGDLISSSPVSEFFCTKSYAQDNGFYGTALTHFTSFGYLPVEDHFKVNVHTKTSLLATYLLNLVCGPFAKVELPEEERYEGIPMTIYCRESLAPFVKNESQNMFDF